MDRYRRFKFVKPFSCRLGVLKADDTITIMGNHVFYNDGMIEPQYYGLLLDLIDKEIKEGFNYLIEIPIPYNKV